MNHGYYQANNGLGHHQNAWKTTKAVILRKLNKLHYTDVKVYLLISLLNCLGMVCKKVVADMLAKLCEVNNLLHNSQIELRRQRTANDTLLRVVSIVQEV